MTLKDFLRGGSEGGRRAQAFFALSLERFSNSTFSLFGAPFLKLTEAKLSLDRSFFKDRKINI